MMALQAKYHLKCLAQLYNRHRKSQAAVASQQEVPDKHLHGIAFAELVMYFFKRRMLSKRFHLFSRWMISQDSVLTIQEIVPTAQD